MSSTPAPQETQLGLQLNILTESLSFLPFLVVMKSNIQLENICCFFFLNFYNKKNCVILCFIRPFSCKHNKLGDTLISSLSGSSPFTLSPLPSKQLYFHSDTFAIDVSVSIENLRNLGLRGERKHMLFVFLRLV